MRLFALILIVPALLVTSASRSASGGWQSIESGRGYRMERIEFDKGSKPGQLHYRQDPMLDEVPAALAIGPVGEIYVMETGGSRIQTFSPEGKFLSALSTTDLQGYGRGLGTHAEFVNIFPVSPYRAKVLVSLEGVSKGSPQLASFMLHGDTRSITGYVAPLGQPPIKGPVERSFLDKEGFLWLLTNRWLILAPDGAPVVNALGRDGTYVDSNGLLYVLDDVVRVFDRQGKPRATLKVDAENPVTIRGGDVSTFLYGLQALSPERKGHLRERQNLLILLRLDRDAQALRIARVQLPPTITSYPTPNPDVMVPIQLYLYGLSALRGNYFYIMGHSEDKYRIDRIDLGPWMRPQR